MRARALALAALAGVLLPSPGPAQDTLPPPPAAPADSVPGISAAAGVAPDTVTVGDHFRGVLRVVVPRGASVEFPQFEMVDPVEARGPVQVARDSAGAWTATYPLVAWSTGDSMVAAISLGVRDSAGVLQHFRVRLRLPVVRSVLPADTTLHVPKPAKAVIPIAAPAPATRGWIVPALLLAAVAALLGWIMLRRRRQTVLPNMDAREAALARLAEIEAAGHVGRGEIVAYHVRVSRVLREYVAARGLGEDLTTTEVIARGRRGLMGEGTARDLERLLRQADRVKFSGSDAGVGREATAAFGGNVRGWIMAWPAATSSAPAGSRREEAA
jgi:hypothetical protein